MELRIIATIILVWASHHWLKVAPGNIDLHSAFVFIGALLFFFGESFGSGLPIWPTSEGDNFQAPSWSPIGIWKILGIFFWIISGICFLVLGI
jgi:hypothetical protein